MAPLDFEDRAAPPDGLPTGQPIEDEAKRWFAEQAKAVLGQIPPDMTDLPDHFLPLANYDDPMSRAMTPILAPYWQESGDSTLGRLEAATGLDLGDWRVTNPHLRAMIQQSALKFCKSTNETTSRDLQTALADLRSSLIEGIVEKGEAPRQLAARVKEIFAGCESWKAHQIAVTEASRAVHAAQEEAAKQSGVVAGFEWLASGDACPMCLAQVANCPRVPIGQPFAIVGTNPDYSHVRFPPLHPNDQCTILEVLLPQYGGPEHPEWGETQHFDGPKKPAVPEPVVGPTPGPGPAIPPPARPVPVPVPGSPILPDRPIAERLAAYTEGDAKVKAILDACAKVAGDTKEALNSTRQRRSDLYGLISRESARAVPDEKKIKELERELARLTASFQDVAGKKRAAVLGVIAAKDACPVAFDLNPADRQDQLSGANKKTAESARKYLGKVLARGEADKLEVKVAQIPIAEDQRAFYRDRINQLHLCAGEKVDVAVHELGHALDNNIVTGGRKAGVVAREFLDHRVGSEVPVKMADVVPGAGYGPREMGRKDHFEAAFGEDLAYYVGKAYRDPHASEITAMGLQRLFTHAEDFARADPEYCKFILGLLDGSLR